MWYAQLCSVEEPDGHMGSEEMKLCLLEEFGGTDSMKCTVCWWF